MCGIYFYYTNTSLFNKLSKSDREDLLENCMKNLSVLFHRGPENTKFICPKENIFIGFQRLAINDVSDLGNQPFCIPSVSYDKNIFLICNGEIFNSDDLVKDHNLQVSSHSDCEVIVYLYKLYGIEKTLELIDGEFSFILYDENTQNIIAARDPYGVRPLFIGYNLDWSTFAFASEAKSLLEFEYVEQFCSGHYWTPQTLYKHYKVNGYAADGQTFYDHKLSNPNKSFDFYCDSIISSLTQAVQKRLHSEREIGCFLSGGLDSSLITALTCILHDRKPQTFSIGMKGSPDLINARKVAEFLGTKHHEVIFTPDEALEIIPTLIYTLETWDVTTIRASVGMFLLSKYVKQNTNVKVLLSGEGADEVCQGYLYFYGAPSADEGHRESVKLLQNLQYFDLLRGDRTTAAFGLELRVPFLDTAFVETYMKINRELKTPDKKYCEKYLLRYAFSKLSLLPDDILWRTKEAFSDGVSSSTNSWHTIIQSHIKTFFHDDMFLDIYNTTIAHYPPKTKEAAWFRKIFDNLIAIKNIKRHELIPYQWLPKWSECLDPSARELQVYKNINN